MDKHRLQSNGEMRDSDNWQLGIEKKAYMKSGYRHFMCWWLRHRGWPVRDPRSVNLQEDLCAVLFNAQGYLHELLKEEVSK